jgi:hypothetical protein
VPDEGLIEREATRSSRTSNGMTRACARVETSMFMVHLLWSGRSCGQSPEVRRVRRPSGRRPARTARTIDCDCRLAWGSGILIVACARPISARPDMGAHTPAPIAVKHDIACVWRFTVSVRWASGRWRLTQANNFRLERVPWPSSVRQVDRSPMRPHSLGGHAGSPPSRASPCRARPGQSGQPRRRAPVGRTC